MRLVFMAAALLPLALAGGVGDVLWQRRPNADEHLRRHLDTILDERQAPPPPPAAATAVQPSTAPATTDTNAACQSQLAKLNGMPTNPSGKSACYNVVAFDSTSGAFQTEVWLYDIGLPTGQWASLLNKGEAVSLQYPGGEVQGTPQKLTLPPMGGNPTLNASVLFTGQLNSTMQKQAGDPTAMRMALMPMINIKAETSDGQFITTNMSNQEAAFINGVFSDPSFTASQAAAFAATGTPFVLPGTTFGIFPTGFIVTLIWTFFFTVALSAGTFGRYKFRSAFRRRGGVSPLPQKSTAPAPMGGAPAAYDRQR